MENNKNMRELYKLYLELGHDVFEEKIKKPLELYLHNNHDGGDVISMFLFNINIANDMESSKLGDDTFDEHDIFSPPTFEEKIYFDDTMPPIYDDYNDEYDIFSPPTIEDKIYYDYDMPPKYDDYHDGYDSLTLTIPNKKDFAYMKSNGTFLHVDHGNNALCDAYIVEFIRDPTENYYEKGTYAYRYFNDIKFPLFMLKVLKLNLFCLPMLIALCFNELFYCNIPMHRKHVRLKCVWYLLLDALFCSSTLIPTRASLKSHASLKGIKESAFGRQPT